MNQTPQPYDPTTMIAAPPPEPTEAPDHAPRRAGLRRAASPVLAGAVALLLAGGAGGYLLARQGGSVASARAVDTAASASFDPASGEAGPDDPGSYGRGHHGGFGHRGRGTAGTIDSVDGSTIRLTTRDGRKVTVTAVGAVPVILRTQGSVADLKPGQTIIVSGPTGSDGSVIANRIAVRVNAPK
jgi:hypothetical protein